MVDWEKKSMQREGKGRREIAGQRQSNRQRRKKTLNIYILKRRNLFVPTLWLRFFSSLFKMYIQNKLFSLKSVKGSEWFKCISECAISVDKMMKRDRKGHTNKNQKKINKSNNSARAEPCQAKPSSVNRKKTKNDHSNEVIIIIIGTNA